MQNKIIKIHKQIRFVIKTFLRIAFGSVISLFIWRDKKLVLIGNYYSPVFKINGKKEQFLHNTKYLYLYLNTINTDLKFVYLCDEKDRIEKMRQCGLKNIYSRKSLKGFYYTLKAKYWITDYDLTVVASPLLSYGAILINLWHGASGLKRFGYDSDRQNPVKNITNFQSFIYEKLRKKDSYYLVNSKYEIQCRKTAFNAKEEQFVLLTSPRLDVLYNNIPNSEMFMEEDFNKIKNFKNAGKKIFIYMPTFRDTGKDVSSWLKSEKLKLFIGNNNVILVCKLHPSDKNSLNFNFSKNFYLMNKDSDVHPILKYTDAMITDYSGIYFDYLHLDKPIIYHIPDLHEYETQCRGFYRPYETLTAGIYTKTDEDIIFAMQDVINGVDNYKDKRKALLDEMFIYKDGKNCERVVEWIKSLG